MSGGVGVVVGGRVGKVGGGWFAEGFVRGVYSV